MAVASRIVSGSPFRWAVDGRARGLIVSLLARRWLLALIWGHAVRLGVQGGCLARVRLAEFAECPPAAEQHLASMRPEPDLLPEPSSDLASDIGRSTVLIANRASDAGLQLHGLEAERSVDFVQLHACADPVSSFVWQGHGHVGGPDVTVARAPPDATWKIRCLEDLGSAPHAAKR